MQALSRTLRQLRLTRQLRAMTISKQPSRPSSSVATDYSSLRGATPAEGPFKKDQPFTVTENPNPSWKYGTGATEIIPSDLTKTHIEIDPFDPDRSMFHNYALLISGLAPRPIGFLSTLSASGTPNLAPFSYFQVVDHDPPVFVIGFSGRGGRPKDSRTNLEETGECVLNIVSEHMIEAVNATSLDAPENVSEWEISGLTKAASTTVKPARVKEAIFSIEGKLLSMQEYNTFRPSEGPHGKLAIIEGTRFWVREDAMAKDGLQIDLNVLRPLGQLGGISYARMSDTFELGRSSWKREMAKDKEGAELRRLVGTEG